jgi:1-aminocyclopropane-1-carboxylate deaminase
MEFYFIPRENYRHKIIPEQITNNEDYIIPEGGYGLLGVKGAATILEQVDKAAYSHIVCAVGTGTMMAGIIHASSATTRVIGIPVVKGADAIQSSIEKMLTQPTAHWQLIPGYEWGGYAKHPDPLLDFMNQFYQTCQIPTDIVYTGKLFYALRDLVANDYFPSGSKILVIHSGGLQGNRSLHPATLRFNVN